MESDMCSLVYRCPQCQREIACGIEVDDVTLATIAFQPLTLTCVSCDAVTVFSVDQGARGDEGSRLQMAKERALAAH
jgi:hypothetical protein